MERKAYAEIRVIVEGLDIENAEHNANAIVTRIKNDSAQSVRAWVDVSYEDHEGD